MKKLPPPHHHHHQAIEVKISPAATDKKSEPTPQEADGTMGKEKRSRSLSPRAEQAEGDHGLISRQAQLGAKMALEATNTTGAEHQRKKTGGRSVRKIRRRKDDP